MVTENRVFKIFKKEHILRGFVHIIFGIPCWWYCVARSWLSRLPHMTLSIGLTLFHWGAFGYEMYIAHKYWRLANGVAKQLPRESTDTLVLMILLFLSGSTTYTLAVVYFYNPKNTFLGPSTRLVPQVEFKPDGEQEDIGPTDIDWIYTNIFLFIGTLDVALMFGADHQSAFFDFCGIKEFEEPKFRKISNATNLEIDTYNNGVRFLFCALEGGVVVCCVFFVMTRDIVRHVEFTQRLILESAWDLSTAKRQYLCLLEYTKKVAGSLKIWFIVHTVLFMFIVLFDVLNLVKSVGVHDHKGTGAGDYHFEKCHGLSWFWVSETTGSFLIAFKFSFPFLAASRVSSRFDNMLKTFNERFNPDDHRNCDSFLTFCERCEAGFKISGIRITFNVAIVSFLSSFVGLLKVYK